MKKTAVILIGFMPNPRIYKRIALEKELFDLHLICWDRGKSMLALSSEAPGCETHCIAIPAGDDPVKRAVPYAKFNARVMKLLKELDPDIIHVQGLDMLKLACRFKKRSAKKVSVIYEVADLHRLLVDKQTNPLRRMAQSYLRREDIRLTKQIDKLIITSELYYDTYFSAFVPAEKKLFIPNMPDLSAFADFARPPRQRPLTVGYIGAVRYKKQMKNLIEAAEKCDLPLLIAGYESEPVEIQPLCEEYAKGEWVGRFDFQSQAAGLYARCDIMYSVYNADMANVRVALPNKLYEAVYCQTPLIVAKGTYLEKLVNEWGIGVGVDHREPDELIRVLRRMNDDPAYYETFVENCRAHRAEIGMEQYNRRLREFLLSL